MSKRTAPERVRDILDCAHAARQLAPSSFEELKSDLKSQLALVRLVEIMGEAANHVDHEVQVRYPDIPWRQIIATRNRVTHGYAGVDLSILWNVLTSRLPELIPRLRAVLEDIGDPGPSDWLPGTHPRT